MRSSRILGPVVAALVVAATGLLALPAAPVAASPASSCAGTAGVIVVVDFNELGGGLTRGCDGASGHTAAQNFGAAGYDLSYSHAPGMNGYVCTVQGKPANGDCTGTDAYWSLWWADGKGGPWTYSSLGVDSLKVPTGGYVAFAWHQGSGKAAPPDVVPSARAASAPSPSAHPTTATGSPHRHAPAHHASPSTGASAPAATGSASASATPTGRPSPSATGTRRPHTQSRGAASAATSAASPSSASSSALPTIDQVSAGPPADTSRDTGAGPGTWIAVAAAVLVIAAAAAVPLLRRRRAG